MESMQRDLSLNKIILCTIGTLFALELTYFNILLDFVFLILLFLTAYSIGSMFTLKLKWIDSFFIQIAIGLGIIGMMIWCTVLLNINYKSVYILICIAVIVMRYKIILKSFLKIKRITKVVYKKNKFHIFFLICIFLFLIIPTSFPIWQYDALAKHVAIPYQILHGTNYDYNVLEFVGFGDYALLNHMFYLFLLALGGTKALTLFNMVISFFILLMLLRLSSKISRSKFVIHAISLIYFSTPLIYILTTTINADLPPFFYLLPVMLVLSYFSVKKIFDLLPHLSFLMGLAFFTKQMAMYFIIPLGMIIIFVGVYNLIRNKYKISALKIFTSLITFLVPFMPSIIIIWYKTGNPLFPFMNGFFKSPYFSDWNFVDPYDNNPLGISLQSLISMTFHTSKNMELGDGGLGFFLFILLIVPFIFIFKRGKSFVLSFVLIFTSYYISTIFTYNIRYFIMSIVLAILTCVISLEYLFSFVKRRRMREIIKYSLIIILIVPNVIFIFHPGTYFGFKKEMLISNQNLLINNNESVLLSVNQKGVRVLSNNDVFRGTFMGNFYTLTWYNDYIVQKVIQKEITPIELLRSFDYYLVDKRLPIQYPEFFDTNSPDISSMISTFNETETHVLYKINLTPQVILDEIIQPPLVTTSENSLAKEIDNKYSSYRIEIDAEKVEEQKESYGRWQINWYNKEGVFINTSLIPFELGESRNVYVSSLISNIPSEANKGLVYLTSHDETPIKIYSYKVIAYSGNRDSLLDLELEKYNERWPHLSK